MRTAASAMRGRLIWTVLWAAVGFASGCEQFDPVRTDNLCDRDDGHAISMLCPQCADPPFAENCSVCRKMLTPDPNMCEPRPPDSPSMNAGNGGEGGTDGGGPTSGDGASGEGGAGAGGESGAGGDGQSGAGSGGMSVPEGGTGGMGPIDPNRCVDDLLCMLNFPGTPACKEGRCVECTSDDNCKGEQGVCNININRCQNCVEDDDCESGRCDEMLSVCVDCEADMDCTEDEVLDNCDTRAHVCVDCVTASGCMDDPVKNACHEATFTCVDCLGDGDCSAEKPACDTQARECVGCLGDGYCKDNVKDACDPETRTCVDCIDNRGCQRGGPNMQCDTERQVCVECTADAHCASGHCVGQKCVECREDEHCLDSTASHCSDSNTCEGCTSNAHCEHLEDTPACSNGRCVECNDDSTCDGTSCIRAQHVCSDVPVGTLGTCVACQADSMCGNNMRCVPLTFAGETYGSHCVYIRSTQTGGSCTSLRPYTRSVSARSLDQATSSTYCVPPSTTSCPGVLDVLGLGKSCANETDCGLGGGADTVCRTNRCTYGCDVANDCPPNLSCQAGGFCG